MLKSIFRGSVVGVALATTLGCGVTTGGVGEPGEGEASTPPGSAQLPTTSGVPFAVGGGRLEAWFLEAGASQIFDSFYDRQLASDCTFMPTGVGARYACFPSATGDVLYLDATCRQPVLRFQAHVSTTPPSWVMNEAGTTGSKRKGYRVAELVPTSSLHQAASAEPQVFALSDAGCVQTAFYSSKSVPSLYRLEPQPEEAFVVAELSLLRLSDDLMLRRLKAEDGAQLTLAVLNGEGQAAATLPRSEPLEAHFGELRWLQQRAPGDATVPPSPLEPGGTFSDEQGFGCHARAGYDHQVECAVDSAEVFQLGTASDANCEHRLYGALGLNGEGSSLPSIAGLRRFDRISASESHLLSFQAYSGPTYQLASGRCEPAALGSLALQVEHVLPLPTFSRVAR